MRSSQLGIHTESVSDQIENRSENYWVYKTLYNSFQYKSEYRYVQILAVDRVLTLLLFIKVNVEVILTQSSSV